MEYAAIYHRPESEYAYLYRLDVVHVRLKTKKDDVAEAFVIHGDPYLFETQRWALDQRTPMVKIASTQQHDYWQARLESETQRLQYAFWLIGQDDSEIFYGERGVLPYCDQHVLTPHNYFRLPFFHESDRFQAPEWVTNTVWYQIFPERFANGDPTRSPEGVLDWYAKKHPEPTDFYGGDLQGIIDRLDYLVDLGINGLYLCPIFEASTNHKYDTIDYYRIDPHFGDEALFKKLVREAHKRGMRVMIDAVFNHMGAFSPQCQDVLLYQERSRYVDWFHIRQFPISRAFDQVPHIDGMRELPYAAFGFEALMPKLNTANPEVQAYLLDIATYWITQCDIDAWRLDVANEVDHQFWKKFHAVTTALKPDFYILGEIWHSSQRWLEGDEFHAVMNYAFTDSIRDYFIVKQLRDVELVSRLYAEMMLYRRQTSEVMFNLLDSHDTARILTMADGNVAAVQSALAFMFLQIGSPCLYYGTEVGMTGHGDPDCRKPMWWRSDWQNHDMLAFCKQLIALRKRYSYFITYGQILLAADDEVITVTRQIGDCCIVGRFNGGTAPVSCTVEGTVLLHNTSDRAVLQPNQFIIYEK